MFGACGMRNARVRESVTLISDAWASDTISGSAALFFSNTAACVHLDLEVFHFFFSFFFSFTPSCFLNFSFYLHAAKPSGGMCNLTISD